MAPVTSFDDSSLYNNVSFSDLLDQIKCGKMQGYNNKDDVYRIKGGLLFAVTKFGYLLIFDILSGVCIFNDHACETDTFVVLPLMLNDNQLQGNSNCQNKQQQQRQSGLMDHGCLGLDKTGKLTYYIINNYGYFKNFINNHSNSNNELLKIVKRWHLFNKYQSCFDQPKPKIDNIKSPRIQIHSTLTSNTPELTSIVAATSMSSSNLSMINVFGDRLAIGSSDNTIASLDKSITTSKVINTVNTSTSVMKTHDDYGLSMTSSKTNTNTENTNSMATNNFSFNDTSAGTRITANSTLTVPASRSMNPSRSESFSIDSSGSFGFGVSMLHNGDDDIKQVTMKKVNDELFEIEFNRLISVGSSITTTNTKQITIRIGKNKINLNENVLFQMICENGNVLALTGLSKQDISRYLKTKNDLCVGHIKILLKKLRQCKNVDSLTMKKVPKLMNNINQTNNKHESQKNLVLLHNYDKIDENCTLVVKNEMDEEFNQFLSKYRNISATNGEIDVNEIEYILAMFGFDINNPNSEMYQILNNYLINSMMKQTNVNAMMDKEKEYSFHKYLKLEKENRALKKQIGKLKNEINQYNGIGLSTLSHVQVSQLCTKLKESYNKCNEYYIDMIRKDSVCIVCMEEKRNVLFEPCGHHICCNNCAHNLYPQKCPYCGQYIETQRQTFG